MSLFDSLNLKTPLLSFLTIFAKLNELKMSKRDFMLGSTCSAYLSVGIDDNRAIFLGMPEWMIHYFREFEISSVSFVRRIRNRDWLVISTDDAANGRSETPVPIRFWFEANYGLFDAFSGIENRHIKLIQHTVSPDGRPSAASDDPDVISEPPLSLQGDWSDTTPILDEGEVSEIVELNIEAEAPPEAEEETLANIQDEVGASTITAEELDGLDIDALLRGG